MVFLVACSFPWWGGLKLVLVLFMVWARASLFLFVCAGRQAEMGDRSVRSIDGPETGSFESHTTGLRNDEWTHA